MISAVALLALAAQAATNLPSAATNTVPPDVLNWAGYGLVPPADRVMPTPFRGAGDWSGVAAGTGTKSAAEPVTWRMRVVILGRVDSLATLPDGTLRQSLDAIDGPTLKRAQDAVGQLTAIVEAETNGRVRLVPDVVTERDPVVTRGDFGKALETYLYPRINGGLYEAEDGVYRGPYASTLVLHPFAREGDRTLTVNGTPVSALSVYQLPDYGADGVIAAHLAELWAAQVRLRARDAGLRGLVANEPLLDSATGLPNPRRFVPAGDWASVAGPDPIPADTLAARLKTPSDDTPIPATHEGKLTLPMWKASDVGAAVGTDPEHGATLVYTERSYWRSGGLALPTPKTGPLVNIAATPTLGFWVKTTTRDPLSLRLVGTDGKTVHVSLGRDVPGPGGEKPVMEMPFANDGAWHRVAIDLHATGFSNLAEIALEPSPTARLYPRLGGPIEYTLADFKASGDPADAPLPPVQAAPDAPEALGRAMWAHGAAASPELLPLVNDPDPMVQLNALQAYLKTKDPTAEAALTQRATISNDPFVAEDALRALYSLGTPTSLIAVRRVLNVGVIDRARAEAALLLSESKDAKVAAEIIPLLEAPGVPARIMAVHALANLPGEQSAIVRMTFLTQSDPELKLEVTRTSDPASDYQVRKLLWSAVNEPSDAVRYESDLKLIASANPQFRAEGYKGVRDDSIWVRKMLLDWFAAHPSEAHRSAIALGLADRSPLVRAAAAKAEAAVGK